MTTLQIYRCWIIYGEFYVDFFCNSYGTNCNPICNCYNHESALISCHSNRPNTLGCSNSLYVSCFVSLPR